MNDMLSQALFAGFTFLIFWIAYRVMLYLSGSDEEGVPSKEHKIGKKESNKLTKVLTEDYTVRNKILFSISLFCMIMIIAFFIFGKIPSFESAKLFSVIGVLLSLSGKFKLVSNSFEISAWTTTHGEEGAHSIVLLIGMLTLILSIFLWL